MKTPLYSFPLTPTKLNCNVLASYATQAAATTPAPAPKAGK
jgi:hypothetical protein